LRILIDISHPAHVHFFRNAINIWKDHGHRVHIVSRQKDIALELLDGFGFDHKCLSRSGKGMVSLFSEMLVHESRLFREARRFKPDIMLQIGGLFVSHVGFACSIPSITFTDTEMATLSNALTFPFTTAVVTPSCYEGTVPHRKHYLYHGYHELAYLHPSRFTPDPAVRGMLGVGKDEPFFIVRFVSWGAAHDVGETGFKRPVKVKMVQELANHGRVFITSEGRLPAELERFRFTLPPQIIHHALAFARLCIGESATMASEAAILGVPAIFVSTSPRGYTTEQERIYDMTYTFSHLRQHDALDKLRELLRTEDLRGIWRAKRQRLMEDKIDVTDWLVKLVEDFPGSLDTLCMRPPAEGGRSLKPIVC
jgi:hypothetical protein